MPLWGNQDLASNTPKTMQLATSTIGGSKANGSALWHNTTPSTFTNGMVEGLYGVTPGMLNVTDPGAGTKVTKSPGWVLVKQGTGPVNNVILYSNTIGNAVITAGGAGYTNTDLILVRETNAVEATANVSTNSTGGIVALAFSYKGLNFANVSALTVYAANSSNQTSLTNTSVGTGATFTFTLANTVGVTGNGYSNTDNFYFSNGAINAVANVFTNGNGAITNLVFSNMGSGFINVTVTEVSQANSSSLAGTNTSLGTGATFTLNLGGRAGRVSGENLVVLPSMTSTYSTALFPNT